MLVLGITADGARAYPPYDVSNSFLTPPVIVMEA